jgi:nucleotide-binding universal stress UspA family protein
MKVLCATDGHPASDAAMTLVRAFADPEKTEIDVVTVSRRGVADPWAASAGLSDREADAHAKTLRDDEIRGFVEAGFRAEGHVLHGHEGEEIVRASAGHDVIVVGAGMTRWVDRMFLGSVSRHVLHASPISVLVVREAPHGRPFEVVLGTDGSRDASRALEQFIALADAERCAVEVVSVVNAALPALALAGAAPGDGTAEGFGDAERRARAAVADAVTALRRAGFATRSAVVSGIPTFRLIDEATDAEADLVVVGSRGLGPLERLVLGSVSESVVRSAPATLVARSEAYRWHLLPTRWQR